MSPSAGIQNESGENGPCEDTDEFWVFGYGSLIWKPPPHFDRRIPGLIMSYVRRFWQSSSDHRGTPESPGRVVTLVPRDEWRALNDEHDVPDAEATWGVVYRIPRAHVAAVRAYLDHREGNGYTTRRVPVYASAAPGAAPVVARAVVYIAACDNPAYVGPMQSVDALARRIYDCRGPSGENREYLYKLAEALRELSPDSKDRHVWDLEERVRLLERQDALLVDK